MAQLALGQRSPRTVLDNGRTGKAVWPRPDAMDREPTQDNLTGTTIEKKQLLVRAKSLKKPRNMPHPQADVPLKSIVAGKLEVLRTQTLRNVNGPSRWGAKLALPQPSGSV